MNIPFTNHLPSEGADRRPPRSVLVIEAPEAMPLIEALEPRPQVMAVRFAHLSRMLLEKLDPDCIALPLLRPGFDALHVIERLMELGYRGHICAVSPPLPDQTMVEAELRAAAPGITVRLIITG
ncbi:hypothetical protein KM031_00095 [Gemmobacter fulvus]|uniref:Uncharacterized protein n=1 Tax=Gemmobacter fulvus TaxID=2840474 RepID=A0A975P5S6_9RHOB|nr:hypothetical protein [Gemmobacter fulvus]MBT9245307.1 hypothetical protein [Gemmobacter fulvus]QWK90370.1 hypothetical protein KM031_00095 [Gemmobacter fulvus]